MTAEFLLAIAGQLLVAGAIYGGIRANLIHAIKTAEKAHERLDAHLENHQ